jgi:uncharacterized protein
MGDVPASPAPRLVAVDAARGLALLGVATATALLWVHGRRLGPGYRPGDRSDLDRAVDLVTALTVDNRVLPVFAVAMGVGLVERLRRTASTAGPGPPGPVRPVLRRAGLLLGLGALHATLVSEADVLGTLAVVLAAGLVLAPARRRWGVLVCVVAVPALVLHGAADGIGGTAGFPDPPSSYALSVVDRVGTWLLALVLVPWTQAGLLACLVLGTWLARSGWLHEPERHRRGLLLTGLAGTAVGLLGALPFARTVASPGLVDLGRASTVGAVSSLTGPAAALGAVALLSLVAGTGRGRTLLAPLARLGRRSLVVYLAASALLAVLLAPWGGGAGTSWGSAALTALGAALWLVALVGVRLAPGAAEGTDGPGPQPRDRQGRLRRSAT